MRVEEPLIFAPTGIRSSDREQLKQRREQEAQTLARLTGWPIESIRKKMGGVPGGDPDPLPTPQAIASPAPVDAWWKRIWK